jgi:hypothetical protein
MSILLWNKTVILNFYALQRNTNDDYRSQLQRCNFNLLSCSDSR